MTVRGVGEDLLKISDWHTPGKKDGAFKPFPRVTN